VGWFPKPLGSPRGIPDFGAGARKVKKTLFLGFLGGWPGGGFSGGPGKGVFGKSRLFGVLAEKPLKNGPHKPLVGEQTPFFDHFWGWPTQTVKLAKSAQKMGFFFNVPGVLRLPDPPEGQKMGFSRKVCFPDPPRNPRKPPKSRFFRKKVKKMGLQAKFHRGVGQFFACRPIFWSKK